MNMIHTRINVLVRNFVEVFIDQFVDALDSQFDEVFCHDLGCFASPCASEIRNAFLLAVSSPSLELKSGDWISWVPNKDFGEAGIAGMIYLHSDEVFQSVFGFELRKVSG